jgi:hypothetical protein
MDHYPGGEMGGRVRCGEVAPQNAGRHAHLQRNRNRQEQHAGACREA